VRLRRMGQRCALATIVETDGSIPSYQSAKLLVREDGSMVGTVGGGCVEAEVLKAARQVLDTEKPRYLSFNLDQNAAKENGLICGGQLNVYLEPIVPQPCAYIFGAGHISKSLSKAAHLAGFTIVIADDRERFANKEQFPEAEEIHAGAYEDIFGKLHVTSYDYVIIVTRGHSHDLRVLRWAVTTEAPYIAMVGSKRKVITITKELEKEGISRETFERISAPMGLDIGAVTPEEIAIAVVAEMIAVRRAPESDWRGISKSIFINPSLRASLK